MIVKQNNRNPYQTKNYFFIDKYHQYDDELILECHVRGDPRPEVQWFRKGLLLLPNERYRFKHHEDGTCQLIINSPSKHTDTGRYNCRATNVAGEDECYTFVRFEGKVEEDFSCSEYRRTQKMYKSRHVKPKDEDEWDTELYHSKRLEKKKEYDHRYKLTWITKPIDKVISRGSTLKLTAMVDGNYPQFEWYHNDVPLVAGRKYQFAVMKDGKGVLVVKNAQTEDSGKYRLVVKNYANSIDCDCNVTVFEAPLHRFEPPLFTNTLSGNKRLPFWPQFLPFVILYSFYSIFSSNFICRIVDLCFMAFIRNVHHGISTNKLSFVYNLKFCS